MKWNLKKIRKQSLQNSLDLKQGFIPLTKLYGIMNIPAELKYTSDHEWIRIEGNQAVLTWANALFQLQSAPSVNGNYTNVPNALSPHPVPLDQSQRYFRLTSP